MEQPVPSILAMLNSPAMRAAVRGAFPQLASLETLEGKIFHNLQLVRLGADGTYGGALIEVEYRATATSEQFYNDPIPQLREAGVIRGDHPGPLTVSGTDNYQQIYTSEGGLDFELKLLLPTSKSIAVGKT